MSRFFSLGAVLAACLLLTAPAVLAQADAVAATAAAQQDSERLARLRVLTDNPETLGAALADRLAASTAETRAAVLQEILYYASYHQSDVDLSATIAELMEVVRHDADPNLRVMASQAICAAGSRADVRAMERIARRDRTRWARERMLQAARATLNA